MRCEIEKQIWPHLRLRMQRIILHTERERKKNNHGHCDQRNDTQMHTDCWPRAFRKPSRDDIQNDYETDQESNNDDDAVDQQNVLFRHVQFQVYLWVIKSMGLTISSRSELFALCSTNSPQPHYIAVRWPNVQLLSDSVFWCVPYRTIPTSSSWSSTCCRAVNAIPLHSGCVCISCAPCICMQQHKWNMPGLFSEPKFIDWICWLVGCIRTGGSFRSAQADEKEMERWAHAGEKRLPNIRGAPQNCNRLEKHARRFFLCVCECVRVCVRSWLLTTMVDFRMQ